MKEYFNKGKALKITCLAIAIVICVGVYNIVKGKYPEAWSKYINSSGINSTIYSYSKEKMDKYSASDSYTLVPTSSDIDSIKAHGANNLYTNLTIDDEKKLKSKWFLSGYGPFLYYAQSNSPEATSITYSEQNNLFNNSNHVYVGHSSADLGDPKSLGIYCYETEISNLPPLLINGNPESLSSTIIDTVKKHNKKNIVVLGGSQRYNTMFGIGEQFNVVRVGGADRNQTYHYLSFAEESSGKIYNISSPPELNSDGIVYDIKTDQIKLTDKLDIESYLKSYNFEAAAKLAAENYQYGAPVNARDGDYEVLIGCKESAGSKKMKFLKVYFLRESAGFQYGVYQYVGTDYKYDSIPDPPLPPPVDNALPTADVNAPSKVTVGDDVYVSGNGYSNDKLVTSLKASINVNGGPAKVNDSPITGELTTFDADSANKKTSVGGVVWFSEEGTYKARTTVTDSKYQSGFSNEVPILAIPPYPVVNVSTVGSLKENRKIIIDATASTGGSKRNKVVWEKTKWEVSAVSGNNSDIRIQKHTSGSTNGEILLDSSRGINKSLDGLSIFDMTFKKPGTYKLTCTLTNDYKEGKTTTKDITINVEPDIPPVADFGMPTYITRNPNSTASNGANQATQTITDTETNENGSYSKDEDIVSDRAWLISFDSNNDGKYEEEKWYIWNESTLKWVYLGNYNAAKNYNFTMPNGNRKSVDFNTTHVGKYDVELKVRERFGQEYIPQFVTDSDRRANSTFN